MNIHSQNNLSAKDATGLQVGDPAPAFTGMDHLGKEFNLENELKNGPVVVIFYRGQWCPVCNRHLSDLQDSLGLISDKGARVIAVSPELPENLEKTASKTKVSFSLIYDKNFQIADAYGVTFSPENKQVFLYNSMLGADLKHSQTDDSERLPIPATYIIDPSGKIIWRHFNPDYRERSTVDDILEHL